MTGVQTCALPISSHGCPVLWPLLTSDRSAGHRCPGSDLEIHRRQVSIRSPRIRAIAFIPCRRRIYTGRFGQYWTLSCTADSSAFHMPLVCGFCSSARDFASGFLQIPPHGGHPCLWLTVPAAKPVRVFHPIVIAHVGRTAKGKPLPYGFP